MDGHVEGEVLGGDEAREHCGAVKFVFGVVELRAGFEDGAFRDEAVERVHFWWWMWRECMGDAGGFMYILRIAGFKNGLGTNIQMRSC